METELNPRKIAKCPFFLLLVKTNEISPRKQKIQSNIYYCDIIYKYWCNIKKFINYSARECEKEDKQLFVL